MKRLFVCLIVVISLSVLLCGCSKEEKEPVDTVGEVDAEEIKLRPTESLLPEEIRPENDFVGVYRNDDYTVTAIQGDDELFSFTVTSEIRDGRSYEWKMSGYFSGDTYRVNYTDGVKVAITYKDSGEEKSRETVYEDGAGRMQFSEDGGLVWSDSMETLTGGNRLERTDGLPVGGS